MSARRVLGLAILAAVSTASTCDSNVGDGTTRPRETVRMSVRATGEDGSGFCSRPSISADGRYVVFESAAEDLVTPDGNGYRDLFLKDRANGELRNLTRVAPSVLRPGGSQPLTMFLNHAFNPVVSADGRFVAFLSIGGFSSPYLQGSNIGIHVLDRSTGNFRRVPDLYHDRDATDLSISDDGRTLAFVSPASNLGFANPTFIPQVYTADLTVTPPVLTLVSRAQASPTTVGNAASSKGRLSRDGSTVVFHSLASNLAGLTGWEKVYLASPPGAAVELVSGLPAFPSTPAGGYHYTPAVSGDGRYVVFHALNSNVTGAWVTDTWIVRVDRGIPGQVARSVAFVADDGVDGSAFPSSAGLIPAFLGISDDGRTIAYGNRSNPAQIRVRDMEGGTLTASVSSSGAPAELSAPFPALSGDGRWVVWSTPAEGLVEGDTNIGDDIYLHGPLR